jgi:hypothetical protein
MLLCKSHVFVLFRVIGTSVMCLFPGHACCPLTFCLAVDTNNICPESTRFYVLDDIPFTQMWSRDIFLLVGIRVCLDANLSSTPSIIHFLRGRKKEETV